MRISIATVCLFIATYATALSVVPKEWHSFKALHGKSYSSPQEEEFRMKVFLENKNKIEEHNRAYENGKVTYTLKMNHFGDLLLHEFKTMMNGLKKREVRTGETYIPSNDNLPQFVDWRTNGAVTPVKNQAQCGSCWAFSATGALEGQMFLKKGKTVSLSEQNLVDCAKNGNLGCDGGNMDTALLYVKKNNGLDTEESYPYEAVDGECRFNPKTVGGTDRGVKNIKVGDEQDLKDAVAKVGPIAVSMDAGHESFQFYSGGIYIEPKCSSTDLDHGVLAVGYGIENGQDYWLVKNSWGAGWGMNGYIKIARNMNNHCGIASDSCYPIV